MTAFDKLIEVMAATFNVAPSNLDAGTKHGEFPAWDSVAHINLIVALEDTFDLQIEVEDFESLLSVRAILDYLKARGHG